MASRTRRPAGKPVSLDLVSAAGPGIRTVAGNEARRLADLLARAQDVATRAHAPYSRFHVGCALESVAGGVFTGCNVENASYGLTICAERSAVTTGVASEGARFRIRRAVVIVQGAEVAFPPCGACRQVLAEFSWREGGEETEFFWPDRDRLVRATLAEILPGAFRL
jgi:cytidine deaminase